VVREVVTANPPAIAMDEKMSERTKKTMGLNIMSSSFSIKIK
jgi:hypothetical protein